MYLNILHTLRYFTWLQIEINPNIDTNVSIAIGLILAWWNRYFLSSFSVLSSCQPAPFFIKLCSLHILHCTFCSSSSAALLRCRAITWLSSADCSSQRDICCCWSLMQSLIIAEKKRSAVWSYFTPVNENVALTNCFLSKKKNNKKLIYKPYIYLVSNQYQDLQYYTPPLAKSKTNVYICTLVFTCWCQCVLLQRFKKNWCTFSWTVPRWPRFKL